MFEPMFVPPREHPLIMRIANATLPLLAQSMGNIRDFHVAPDDFSRLQELGPHRAILSPNHPTGLDPFAMFWLSRKLGQPFNYLAAREVLDGVKGWIMNRVGTYSVIRGVADRESLRTTRKLLAEQDRKVVIFPEGEIYEHNDRLLAFQSGVAQIGFWVLDDLGANGELGTVGSYGWGSAYFPQYVVDPKERLIAFFMTQHMPSGGLDLNQRFKVLMYQALVK